MPRYNTSKIPPDPNPSGRCNCGCGLPTTLITNTARKQGWYKGHHARYRRGHHIARRPVPVEEYAVEDRGYTTPCWIWQRGLGRGGYGRTGSNGKSRYAHVVYWERKHGPVPTGRQLDHLCRQRPCCNPDHVEPVSSSINVQRSTLAKITPDTVRLIRDLRDVMALSYAEIAVLAGISKGHAWSIATGKNWTNIKQDDDREPAYDYQN